MGKEILLLTDSEAVVYGWDSKKVTNDKSASIIIKSIHLIAAFLGCWVTVQHLPRVSTPAARLTDRLTRKSTTTAADRKAVQDVTCSPVPSALSRWLAYPTEDWSLPNRLLDAVKKQLPHL